MARNEAKDSIASKFFTDRKASMSVAGNTLDLVNSASQSMVISPTGVQQRRASVRPSRNNNKTDLSIMEVTGLSDMKYGMGFYKTPSNEMLLKRVHNGQTSKKKLFTFADEILKKKKGIPGPQYS